MEFCQCAITTISFSPGPSSISTDLLIRQIHPSYSFPVLSIRERPGVKRNASINMQAIASTATIPWTGATSAVGPDGELYVVWAGPDGLIFDRSYDEGDTWLDEDIIIGEFPGGWDYAIPGLFLLQRVAYFEMRYQRRTE